MFSKLIMVIANQCDFCSKVFHQNILQQLLMLANRARRKLEVENVSLCMQERITGRQKEQLGPQAEILIHFFYCRHMLIEIGSFKVLLCSPQSFPPAPHPHFLAKSVFFPHWKLRLLYKLNMYEFC